MKKILIIEDDEQTLEVLGLLAKTYKINVELRSEILSLVEIEKLNPDLVFLDQRIGPKLGSDLCLEIKQNEATKDIPVILISAVKEIGQIAMDNYADGCIIKPFDIEEIEQVIEGYIG